MPKSYLTKLKLTLLIFSICFEAIGLGVKPNTYSFLFLLQSQQRVIKMTFTQQSLHDLNLKPGDILLFSNSDWYGRIIKTFTGSKWTHVGMIVEWNGQLCLFEATSSLLKSGVGYSLSGKVRTIFLEDILNTYDGTVALRRLTRPLTKKQLLKLEQTVQRYIGVSYERNLSELFKSAIDAPKWWYSIPILNKIVSYFSDNKEDLSSIFCSELVVTVFREIGVGSYAQPSNEFTPADLSTNSKYLPFQGDEVFIQEIIIK